MPYSLDDYCPATPATGADPALIIEALELRAIAEWEADPAPRESLTAYVMRRVDQLVSTGEMA